MKNRLWIPSVLLLLTGAVLLSYKNLSHVYYLNDEWRMLANVYIHGLNATWYKETITDYPWYLLILGKTRALSTVIYNYIFLKAPLNTIPFVAIFYIFHILNSILIYFVTVQLTKRRSIALITALFFAVTVRHSQSLLWIGAGIQVLISGFFCFLALLLFLKYTEKRDLKFIIAAVACSYISFLQRPNVIFLIPFFTVIMTLRTRRTNLYRRFLKYTVLILIVCFCSLFAMYKLSIHGFPLFSPNALQTAGTGFINTLYYPFISLGHYLIHPDLLLRLSRWVLSVQYSMIPKDTDTFYLLYFVIADMITQPISLVMLLSVLYVWRKWNVMRSPLTLAGVWYFMAFLPVNFVLLQRYSSYIESRYVYYQSFSIGLFIAVLFVYIYQTIPSLIPKFVKSARFISILFLCFFFYKQIQITQREVNVWSERGQEMAAFVRLWQKNTLNIPKNPVFFINSDRFFMNPYTKLPFMLGDGFILSILLYPTHEIPPSDMSDQYLSAYGSQGYRVIDGKGYGYFYTMDELKKAFRENASLSTDQLVAFYYHGYTHKIEDITDKIRAEVLTQNEK